MHPLDKVSRKELLEAKDLVKAVSDKDLLVTLNEFLYRIGQDQSAIGSIKESWRVIRDQAIRNLEKKDRLLVLASNYQLFARISYPTS